MFLIQIILFEKNQPADSKSNKIKKDQDNGDQLA